MPAITLPGPMRAIPALALLLFLNSRPGMSEPLQDSTTQKETSETTSKQKRKIDPKTGMVVRDLKYVRFSLGLDYLLFGGQVEHGFTPSVSSNISSFLEFYKLPGRFMIRLRPEALGSVLEARREVKNSYAFEQQYKLGARAVLAKSLGIPINLVDKLVPPSAIAKAEAQVKAVASRAVDDRIDYTAAAKTALDGVTYSLSFARNLEASIGKDFPDQENDFLPVGSSLIFGSVPNASLKYGGGSIVATLRVYHDRKSIESPFGVANAYVRSIMRDGVQFFSIKPDSAEISLRFEDSLLQKQGLGMVKKLIIGGGSRDEEPYGFLRVDFEKQRFYMRNLVSRQAFQKGFLTQYSAFATCRVMSRIALGATYYLRTGATADSFYNVQPLLDLTLRKRPWAGWLGNYQTHFMLKRGYSRGSLVKVLAGRSDVVRDWNFEIQMVRNPR